MVKIEETLVPPSWESNIKDKKFIVPPLDDDLKKMAVAYLRTELSEETKNCVRKLNASDGKNWYFQYHFYAGMTIRNLLREIIPDSKLPTQNWDDYYVECWEAAVKEYYVECWEATMKKEEDSVVLPAPPEGYEYVLQMTHRKKCAKCGKKTEFYTTGCFGSRYDGLPVCAECLDK